MFSLDIRNRKFLASIFLLIIFILFISGIILFLNKKESSEYSSMLDSKKELATLSDKISNSVPNDDKKKSDYQQVVKRINVAKTATNEEEKYIAIKSTSRYLMLLYSLTSNEKLYSLINSDLNEYAKKNLSKFYDKRDFIYPCQDPTCAKSEQPEEVLGIVEDIKNSDIPDAYKTFFSQDMLTVSYYTDQKMVAANAYFYTMQSLEASDDLSKRGDNKVIANKIRSFLIKNFEEEYPLILKGYRKEENENNN